MSKKTERWAVAAVKHHAIEAVTLLRAICDGPEQELRDRIAEGRELLARIEQAGKKDPSFFYFSVFTWNDDCGHRHATKAQATRCLARVERRAGYDRWHIGKVFTGRDPEGNDFTAEPPEFWIVHGQANRPA